MKSILMSIKPKWVAKILNGEKTIEIRKTAPKDWLDYLSGKTKVKPEPSTVYIYCTKGEDLLCQIDHEWGTIKVIRGAKLKSKFNGKVIAKYTLREVEVFSVQAPYDGRERKILNEANLMIGEARAYAGGTHPYYNPLYAYHISDLEIFDEPMKLKDFMKYGTPPYEATRGVR